MAAKRTYPVGTFGEKLAATVAKDTLTREWPEDSFSLVYTETDREPYAVWCTTTQACEG